MPSAADAATRIDLVSDPFAVRDALASLRSSWDGQQLDTELCDTAEQVLAEVLNNIVEHAHAENQDGAIKISVTSHDGELAFNVRDNGVPMPRGELPAGAPAKVDGERDDLPEGGFGWFLIRALAEDLSYMRESDWNVFRFKICAVDRPVETT